ncbi:MAG: VTC domain-containing protein [Candidatus Paceibacterota bacterium]|jgi:hypothetical protein
MSTRNNAMLSKGAVRLLGRQFLKGIETRMEEGYFLEAKRLDGFLKQLNVISCEQKYSNGYNQTIYFNNTDHEVPFGLSVRARGYAPAQTGKQFRPDFQKEWKFEVKKSTHNLSRKREKFFAHIPLVDIIKKLNKRPPLLYFVPAKPLMPHVAATYQRAHYYVKNNERFRVTIDRDVRYYVFETSRTAVRIGSEDRTVRVELKFDVALLDSKLYRRVIKILHAHGAEQLLSKKQAAYDAEYQLLKRKYKKWLENSDTEIESKLSLPVNKQYIFTQLKHDFRKGKLKAFRIAKGCEDSWEHTNFARYVIAGDGSYIRLTHNGKKVVYKSNEVIARNRFGLGCILQRREIAKRAPQALLQKPYFLRLRTRKTFIVEHIITKDLYILLIDHVAAGGKDLYQLEVENISFSPSESKREKIVNDIACITQYIIKRYKLRPTRMTKLDWVKKVATVQTMHL